jgi:hypothetical protein
MVVNLINIFIYREWKINQIILLSRMIK